MNKVALTILVAIILPILSPCSFAQRSIVYDFENGLESVERNGPPLQIIGDRGQFKKELIVDLENSQKNVYYFPMNSGLQFNNKQANGLLDNSFTIELYFKLATINDWKRIIDFKNRTSDNGPYLHKARLNFFNFITGQNIAVKPNQYIHYVYSRDARTDLVKMYINGESRIEFKDVTKEGILSEAGLLNFFQDDLIVNYEASDGAIALIRLYDQVLDPSLIKNQFIDIHQKGIPSTSPNPKQETSLLNTPPISITTPAIEQIPKTAPIAASPTYNLAGKIYNSQQMVPVIGARVQAINDQGVKVGEYISDSTGAYFFSLESYRPYRIRIDSKKYQPKQLSTHAGSVTTPTRLITHLESRNLSLPVLILYFDKDSLHLTDHSKQALDSFLLDIKEPTKLFLEGHSSLRASMSESISTGEVLASHVEQYLRSHAQAVQNLQIQLRSYGSARPLVNARSKEASQLNNRVEIYLQ